MAISSGTELSIADSTASGSIAPPGLAVVASTDMAALGSTDPAGIAYVPGMGFFVSDSEVEESPFIRTTNLWKLQSDGTLVESSSLLNFTNEPTGLAYDSGTGRLYISDDDHTRFSGLIRPIPLSSWENSISGIWAATTPRT